MTMHSVKHLDKNDGWDVCLGPELKEYSSDSTLGHPFAPTLPLPGDHIESLEQLVYCLTLLHLSSKSASGTDSDLAKKELAWLELIKKDPMEADRLRWLATRVVEQFVADANKDTTKIAEIVALGPVLEKEPYRKLLATFIKEFDDARILDVDMLQGLVQLVQDASPGYLVSDDLVKILGILRDRLESTHYQSTEYPHHLTQAVSRILDVMADHKMQDLNRVLEHEPLSAVLSGLKDSSDPYLMYQACYAFQALQYVHDNESALQAVLRHSTGVEDLVKVTAAFKSDLSLVLNGLGRLQEALGGAISAAGTVYEGICSLKESGRGVLESLKEGLGYGQKQSWYPAVKVAYAFTQAGQLKDLNQLVVEAPCRRDPLFQWGISQLLGEIAVDAIWSVIERQQAVSLLGHLFQYDQDWSQDESVKAWMLTLITRLCASSDQAVRDTACSLLQDLRVDQSALIKYPYPLRSHLPIPDASPLFAKAQSIQYLEYELHKFRLQRLEEIKLPVYISPMAKANLQARDDDIFPLMEKVMEFLASDRQVMLILGDSGAGKSTFNKYLESELLRTYTRGGLIPMLINLPAIDEPDRNMIEKQLRSDNFNDEHIRELKLQRQLILICDGYDESQQLANLHKTNMLNQPGQWNTKMVISCRTQYLGQDYRSQFMPQNRDHYARPAVDLFQEALISPFSNAQIQRYIEQYIPLEPRTWTTKDYMDRLTTIPNLMDLVRNPFVLTLALEALPLVTEGKQDLSVIDITRVQLYDTFVKRWLDVNKRRLESNTLSPLDRDTFDLLLSAGFTFMGIDYSIRLASAIFEEQDGNPIVRYTHLKDKNTWRVDFFGPDPEVRLLRESSPLTRSGNLFRFLHRSMQEYFYSRTVFDPSSHDDHEEFAPQSDIYVSGPALSDSSDTLFKRSLLTEPSVIQFLCERVKHHPDFKSRLLAIIERSKLDATATTAAANAITILVRAGVHFNGADLQGIRIPGADLSGGQFDSVKFQKADLTDVNFTRTWLRQVDFTHAKMKGARFGQLPSIESARAIESGAYSPDGSMIALGEYDGDIEVIDTINWNRKYLLSGHSRNTISLAFSPDSRRLVSGGHDAELRLWDLTKGECLFVMEEHENWVNEVRFSPCGKKIASASHDYTVRIWDADTGKRLHILEGHTHYVLSIDFSPNGRRLGSGGEDGTLRFWDVETGDAEAVADDYGTVYKVAWSPNGEWMAMSGYDKAEIRDCHHLGLLAVLEGHVGKILNLAYSPNGELLVTAGEDHTVRVWDAATGTQVSLFTDHGGYVKFCKFSSDGQRIASGGDDHRLRLWDVFGSGTLTTGAGFGHLSCVNEVNYTPDGKSLFSCSGIGEVRNWVASTGAAGPVRIEGIADLLATAISPDGMIFAGGGRDRDDSTIIQLWDCRTGATLRALEGHDAFIYDLAFSPCGRYIASASVDQTAYLWDLQDKNSKPHTLVELDQNNSDCPRFVAFSPMADKLALGFRNSAIHLYNYQTKHLLKTFQGDKLSLGSMAFSPSGRQMVFGTSINSLYLWDLESKTHNAKLDGLENWPLTVAYSPCGCWIASGGQDRRVSLWKKESDSEQQSISWSLAHVITSFSGTVSTLAWNPQDKFEFATGCNDKSVRIWTVKHDKETKRTDVYLKWGSEFGELVAMDTIVSGAEDLNVTNKMVLVERGAFGSTIVENSLSCTLEE